MKANTRQLIRHLFVLTVFMFNALDVRGDENYPHPVIYPNLEPPFDGVVDLVYEGILEVIPRAERFGYENSIVTGKSPILISNKAIREHQAAFDGQAEIVGGLAELRVSEKLYGVSFFIDPALYVEQINILSSDVDSIVFFYNNLRSDPPSLEHITFNDSVSIKSVSASNSSGAFTAFAEENASASDRTAFVFTRGFIEISTNALLDFILTESWNSGAITVASNASYVKAGLTMGLIPDFVSYGNQIATLLLKAENEMFSSPRVEYLRTSTNALNVRTAQRSSIAINDHLLRQFKYSYPVR